MVDTTAARWGARWHGGRILVCLGAVACSVPGGSAESAGPATLEAVDRPAVRVATEAERASVPTLTCETPAGADWRFAAPRWLGEAPAAPPEHYAGFGVGLGDLDGDGYLDVLRPGWEGVDVHWGGPDGPDPVGEALLGDLDRASAAYPVDLDGDGWLEILVVRWGRTNVLLATDDGSTWAPVVSGLEGDEEAHTGAAFGDVDGDGLLDVVISTFGATPRDRSPRPDESEPTALYLQQPDGTFRSGGERLPPAAWGGHSWAVSLADVDDDGDLDVYLLNDFVEEGWGNRLFLNDGTGWFAWAEGVGAAVPGAGMGFAAADLDNDLDLDWAVSGWAETPTLLQTTGPLYADAAPALGIVPEGDQVVAWGLDAGDVDHDGQLDLWAGFGFLPILASRGVLASPNPLEQPDALYVQQQDCFVDEAPARGADEASASRAGALLDVDGDGWLDLVTREQDGRVAWRTRPCGEAAWLEVTLDQPGANPRAVGARVWATVGERTWQADVHVGRSLGTGVPPVAHLGLGEATGVDRLEVRWPDGERQVWEDVPVRARVVLGRDGSVRGR